MAFASLGLRVGLAGLAIRSTPQRTCFVARTFSTRPSASLLRSKVATPSLFLSTRRTYASKVPEEPASVSANALPESESLPLDAATSDPLAASSITDVITQNIPPMAYGDLAALGLTSWSPIGIIAWSYELIHVSTGMPWFWTIIAGSAFWRFVCMPFALNAVRTSARLRPIQGKIVKIQERITEARSKQDIVAMQRAGLEMKNLYAEVGVNPITGLMLPNVAQLPITIGLFFALKRICTHPVEQLKDGGVGSWFWANDLTAMDPYYILPAIFTAMINLQITVGGRDIDTSGSPMSGHIMNVFRVLSLVGVFFMSSFPAGLFLGLITTSTMTIAQSLALRSDAVRRMLNIPIVPVSQQGKVPSMLESIKFAREKWLEAQRDAQTVKRRGPGGFSTIFAHRVSFTISILNPVVAPVYPLFPVHCPAALNEEGSSVPPFNANGYPERVNGRGHRRSSFVASDINELVELRARQRTFHGAYSRTALGALGYSLTILRLFDKAFHRIGLLFAVLGGLLFIISFFRARQSNHDFADRHKEAAFLDSAIPTVGQDNGRIFGRPFVTAGWSVLQVAVVVGAVEIALLVLILNHDYAQK
ncbi:hypothetical protein NMY22_g5000 [Coprinellus aureogranulatus]|nr:hypothetical protein NMY22_g5000 [Coprinellus aureogranulatus]